MSIDSLRTGDEMICPGVGAGHIEGFVTHEGAEHLLLRFSATDDLHRFPVSTAAAALRRPMPVASAEQHWAELTTPGQPDPRPWTQRYTDLVAALQGGRPADQVARLRTLYGSPSSPSPGEFRLITVYENALLSELATVLGRSFDDLKTEARAAAPTFGGGLP